MVATFFVQKSKDLLVKKKHANTLKQDKKRVFKLKNNNNLEFWFFDKMEVIYLDLIFQLEISIIYCKNTVNV